MKKTIKSISIIMTIMVIMILSTCAQGNSSDNNEGTKTGIIGKWIEDGYVIEFTSNGEINKEDGSHIGYWTGNDTEGECSVKNASDGAYIEFYYTISSNNMTLIGKQNSNLTSYFTRM